MLGSIVLVMLLGWFGYTLYMTLHAAAPAEYTQIVRRPARPQATEEPVSVTAITPHEVGELVAQS